MPTKHPNTPAWVKRLPFRKVKPKGSKAVAQTTFRGQRFSRSKDQRTVFNMRGLPYTGIYRMPNGKLVRVRVNSKKKKTHH